MADVCVIGAGFSGLTTAYYLTRARFKVEIFEKNNRPGGLISTLKTPWGFCEAAANGVMNSPEFEKLCSDINVKLTGTTRAGRKRYIFRDRPRRWPLSFSETASMIFHYITQNKAPRAFESINQWGDRNLGRGARQNLLAPALQGIYAGDSSELSASLILSKRIPRRGLVAPSGGMEKLILGLEKYLLNSGVKIHYGVQKKIDQSFKTHVLSVPPLASAELLSEISPEVSKELREIKTIPLVRVTCFLKPGSKQLKGFGVLIPKEYKSPVLGILFNNFIFPSDGVSPSESFILGGPHFDATQYADGEILKIITEERRRVLGLNLEYQGYHIQRWPRAIPYYTVELEKILGELTKPLEDLRQKGIFISGNFLGGIGLSSLLFQSSKVAEAVKKRGGSS